MTSSMSNVEPIWRLYKLKKSFWWAMSGPHWPSQTCFRYQNTSNNNIQI